MLREVETNETVARCVRPLHRVCPGGQFVSSAQKIDEILQILVSHWRRQSKTVINTPILARIQYIQLFYGLTGLSP